MGRGAGAPRGGGDCSSLPQCPAHAFTLLTSCSCSMAPLPSAAATSVKCGVSSRGWCCPSPEQSVRRVCDSPRCSTATTLGERLLAAGAQRSHQDPSPRQGQISPKPLSQALGNPEPPSQDLLYRQSRDLLDRAPETPPAWRPARDRGSVSRSEEGGPRAFRGPCLLDSHVPAP